ncbi:unnamed protein product [Sphagnum jensenii]|jgi:hypothetical protein|uniref:Uncharacterized protein n=1 Tax=Sphagnum jensenii TaxID=128206 RepID=A0ABP0VY47_9BRYO
MDGSVPIAVAAVASQEDREAVVPETSGDSFVSEELVMENGGEGGGAEEEENGDLSNQQLVTDAELEALLSAAPSLPEESAGVKLPNGKREESTAAAAAAAASGGTVSERVSAASSSLLKKRNNVGSSFRSTTTRTLPPPSQTFLRSSSTKAAARHLLETSGDDPNLVSEKGANAIEKHSSSSTSDSAPSTPVMRRSLSGYSTRTSAITFPSSTPTTTQSRRASLRFRLLLLLLQARIVGLLFCLPARLSTDRWT